MALFTTTAYPVVALIEDISLGKIGLPEIQRPFVWPNVNVRNLFDSLYRGYPAGHLLFWETGADPNMRRIGEHYDQKAPSLAIVDGQQRLTSLYAIIKGKEVIRSNFIKDRIRIAFNPLQSRFDVTDASIVKDKAYIADISELWKPETNVFEFANQFIADLNWGWLHNRVVPAVLRVGPRAARNPPSFGLADCPRGSESDRIVAEGHQQISHALCDCFSGCNPSLTATSQGS
jgi:hypothetical protein